MYIDNQQLPLRGIEGTKLSKLVDRDTVYDCLNFAPSQTLYGRLEQTPYFYLESTLSRTDYYNAGTVTESAAARVLGLMMSRDGYVHIVTDVTLKFSTTNGVQVFYQTTYPAASTIYTGCMLTIPNRTGLGITLGLTLDVEMTGAAAFRWRKNGGGWTAGVPSTSGVSIDGGNAILYFLASSGFAGTEAWSWTRTDCSCGNATALSTRQTPYILWNDDIYYISPDFQLMRIETSATVPVAISAGYRPVFGLHLTKFFDHLVVTGYSATRPASGVASISATVAWSDLNDLDCFIATDTNEADSYTFQDAQTCIGATVQQQQLFVVTTEGIHVTSYLGLPTVFSFQRHSDFDCTYSFNSNHIVEGLNEILILSPYEIWRFDGVSLTNIGLPIKRFLSTLTGSVYPISGFFDTKQRQYFLVQPDNNRVLVFNKDYNFWYRRSAYFETGSGPYCVTTDSMTAVTFRLHLGGTNLHLYCEHTEWDGTQTPVKDVSAGASYTSPTVTMQMIENGLKTVFEVSSTFLGVATTSVSGTTKYSTGQYLQAKLYWYTSDVGIITGSPSTDSGAIWTSSAASGLLSYPRKSARGIALEVQITGTSGSLPPGQCYLYNIVPAVRTVGGVVR